MKRNSTPLPPPPPNIYLIFSIFLGQLCAHHQNYCIYVTLVFFTLYGWLSGLMQQTRQPPIQSEKYQCRINTMNSPDDGHIVALNM